MKKRSLLTRLLVSHIFVIVVTLCVVGFLASSLIGQYYVSVRERELERRGQSIAPQFVQRGGLSYNKELLETLDKTAEARIIIADPGGRVIASTAPGVEVGSFIGPQGATPIRPQWKPGEVPPGFKEPVMSVEIPIRGGNDVVGRMILGAPSDPISGVLKAFQWYMFMAGLAAIALSLPISYAIARSISRPVNEIGDIALDMVQGDLKQRIPVRSNDELGQLAVNFNQMADAVDNLIGALAGEKAQLESLLASMSEGVIAIDDDSQITLLNKRAQVVMDIPAGTAMPGVLSDLANGEPLRALVSDMRSSGVSSSMEFTVHDRYVVAYGAFIRPEDTDNGGIVIVLQDVTRIMASEELRTSLLANMAHEFRTPLASIKAYTQAMIDLAHDEPTRRKYLATIENETERLSNLVKGLLDTSLKEGGRVQWETVPVDMKDVAESVALCYDEPGRKITVEAPDDLPMIPGDESRLEQALRNLVDNAVRFSEPDAPIAIQVAASDTAVSVSVIDHGQGIAVADLPRVWDRFFRVEKSRSRKEGGAGLGLSIVKEIVQAHNGTVNAESVVGSGSVFSFTLPLY